KELCSYVQKRKDREIRIKREDTQRFFNTKIREEDERLQDYKKRLSLGEDMAIAIRGSEKRLEDLKTGLTKALDRLEEEDLVVERDPELISSAICVPRSKI
ncbi:MAG: hypothetical protein H8D67_04580, partial [Deltaproteobacteria bacterium]|nr:hypothetical protein [Deltaproteobacteria bacterium]